MYLDTCKREVSKYIAFFHRRFLVFRKGVATERHENPPIPVQETGSLQEMGLKSRRLLLDSGGLATRKTVTHSHTLGGEESEGRRNTFFLHKEENRFI